MLMHVLTMLINGQSEFGRSKSVWEETNVIGVTAPIYNDTISVTKTLL